MNEAAELQGVAGVTLAGGAGARLGGVQKARLRMGGKTLLTRACEALEGQADTIVVSIGHHRATDFDLAPGQIPLSDPAGKLAGPVSGLAAAVAWALQQGTPPRFLLSLAVDTPFFPREFAGVAVRTIAGHGAAVAAFAGQAYPTNALWRLEALQDLPERVSSGTSPRSLKAIAAEIGAVSVDWADRASSDPFLNINTLADLIALGRRADVRGPGCGK